MKRRLSNDASGPGEGSRRRRQPQISCNFCRSKKLKCDRGQPCSNCTARGIPCDGQSSPAVSRTLGPSPSSDHDVLERLRRLEETVFGSSASPTSGAQQESQTVSTSGLVLDRSNDLDYNNGGESLALDDCDIFTFRITGSRECYSPRPIKVRYIDLPSQVDVLSLFENYLNSSDSQVPNVLYPSSVQALSDGVYSQLQQGHRINLGSAGLILSICAAGAFFWDDGFSSSFRFQSQDSAAAQCVIWRNAAWDLLDQAQRAASHSLEAIQARIVLADLLYNMEGTTSRYRYLQSCARATAYEMRLHLVDLPGNSSQDTPIALETKRRLWWHIASTDWLLSTMGGNVDRVYTVNPKHMRVNYPCHIAESTEHTVSSFIDWPEAIIMHMNVRIRVAEALRETVDALPLGSGDVDTLPYSKIAALDKNFERILTEYPLFDIGMLPVDAEAKRIALQRASGWLSIQARRARFLRPFVQIKNIPERFAIFRQKCLNAAQSVMETASSVLSEAVDTPSSTASGIQDSQKRSTELNSRRTAYPSGLLINHLFMACAVLAVDPSLRGGIDVTDSTLDQETELRRTKLANACRLLVKAGEKNPVAQGMVRRLVGILRKHRIHGVEDDKGGPMTTQETETSASSARLVNTGEVTSKLQKYPDEHEKAIEPWRPRVSQQQQQLQEQQQGDQNWVNDPLDQNALNGIWNDFLGTGSTSHGWEQLFADLDYLNGGI